MKRIVGLILLALLLLIIMAGGLWWYSFKGQELPPVFSSLFLEGQAAEDQDWIVGDFSLDWDSDRKQLTVTPVTRQGQIIFATPADRGFLAGGVGELQSEEQRGYFFMEEERQIIYDQQTISQIDKEDNQLQLAGTLSCSEGNEVDYSFILEAVSPGRLRYQVQWEDEDINRTYLSWSLEEDEHIFGLGTQYSYFDLRGQRVPILVQEQGIGRGAQPLTFLAEITNRAGGSPFHTYAPVPHFISSELRSLFSINKEYQVFHFTENKAAQLELFSGKAEGYIYAGESPAALVEEHTGVVGRMEPLPSWTQEGLILGVQGGTDEVRRKIEIMKGSGVPLAGLWIQDWVGQRRTSFGYQLWWNWERDQDHYNDWDNFREELNEDGIQLLGYVNPFVVSVEDKDNVRRDLYREAREKGFVLQDEAGEPLEFLLTDFTGNLLDLTIEEAREWIKEVITAEMIQEGFSGWMADFGEALPLDAVMASGDKGIYYHNRYPEEWARINREALQEAGLEGEGLFFVRAGFSDSPGQASAFWLGDQNVTWDAHDGIKTAVTGLLSSGLSGFSLNHSDIGGYTSITDLFLNYVRSEELLLRWIELNAFTSLFRSHEGNRPDENLQVYSNDRIVNHVQKFASIFRDLAPYRQKLMLEAEEKGAPLVRPLFFHYPHDPQTYDLTYQQFMLGPDLIVAPVLDADQEEVEVYLPRGTWQHHWSSDLYQVQEEGQVVSVPAPLGQPGVFYSPGSIPAELLGD